MVQKTPLVLYSGELSEIRPLDNLSVPLPVNDTDVANKLYVKNFSTKAVTLDLDFGSSLVSSKKFVVPFSGAILGQVVSIQELPILDNNEFDSLILSGVVSNTDELTIFSHVYPGFISGIRKVIITLDALGKTSETVTPPCTVTSVTPNNGTTTGFPSLVINGTNFTGVSNVKIGNNSVTNLVVVSPTQITCTAPSNSAGIYDVYVFGPVNTATLSSGFTYTLALPSVLSVSPNNGPTTGGTIVTINGTNLNGTTSVMFGNVPASNITNVSASQITCTSPSNVESTVSITVTTSVGSGMLPAAFSYTLPNQWFPSNSQISLDLKGDRSNINGSESTIGSLITVTRSSSKQELQTNGLYSSYGPNILARTNLGLSIEQQVTRHNGQPRNLSHTSWIKTGMLAVLNQTGVDGLANSATAITANASNATVSQAIADTSRLRTASLFAKRLGGEGPLELSIDGGATWQDITPISSSWEREELLVPQTLANPNIQLRVPVLGDSFGIDYVQLEGNFTTPSSPILGTASPTIRQADVAVLTNPSPVSANSGTIYLEWEDLVGPVGTLGNIWTNRIDGNNILSLTVTTANLIQFTVRASGATNPTLTGTIPVVKNGIYRAAITYQSGDIAVALSANAVDTLKTSTVNFTMTGSNNVVGFGQNGAGAAIRPIRLREFHYSTVRASNGALQNWAGTSAPVPISFNLGESFTPPSGLNWPATRAGKTLPTYVTWNGTRFVPNDGTYDPKILVDPAIWTVNPVYVDINMPDNSGDGLSWATAKKSIWAAINTANADSQLASRIIIKAGLYDYLNSINGTTNVEPTKPCAFISDSGTVFHCNMDLFNFPTNTDPIFTSSYVGGPTTVARAFDLSNLNVYGLPSEIPILSSQAEVNSTSTGGIFNSGDITTIRRADGLRPTTLNTRIFSNYTCANFDDTQKDLYFEGIDFEGGLLGSVVIQQTQSTRNIVAIRCKARYSGNSSNLWDAFIVQATDGVVYTDRCDFSYGMKDGFNVHAGGGSLTHVFCINPTGYSNGKLPAGSTNWLTTHEDVIAFFAGQPTPYGYCNVGRNFHSIDTTRTYAVGLHSVAISRAAPNDMSFAVTGGTAFMWLEKCTAESSRFAFQSGASMFLRNCRVISGTNSILAGGTINTF